MRRTAMGEYISRSSVWEKSAMSAEGACNRNTAATARRFGYVDMAFVAPGVSVATFETPAHAAAAMRALRGYYFGFGRMNLAFAKPAVSFE